MAIDLTARRAQGHYSSSDTILMRNKCAAIPEDFTAEGKWIGGQSTQHQQFQVIDGGRARKNTATRSKTTSRKPASF